MNKILLYLLIIFLILNGILVWYYLSFTNANLKTVTPETTTLKTSINIVQYPVNPTIAEKIKKAGVIPLFQTVQTDLNGRNIVISGGKSKYNMGNFVVVETIPITNSKDIYLSFTDPTDTEIKKEKWVRIIINENKTYPKTLILRDNLLFSEESADKFTLIPFENTLFQKNDVVGILTRVTPEMDEILDKNNMMISHSIVIRRL